MSTKLIEQLLIISCISNKQANCLGQFSFGRLGGIIYSQAKLS